jgi:hypothetical protein
MLEAEVEAGAITVASNANEINRTVPLMLMLHSVDDAPQDPREWKNERQSVLLSTR